MLEIDVRAALHDFSLSVKAKLEHRATGVFGPSGAGKSTLLEAVAGIRTARGRVSLDDTVFFDSDAGTLLSPGKRDVGWVPQDALLFPGSVDKNLSAGTMRARRRGLDDKSLTQEVIDTLSLAPLLGRDVRNLSGGERRRVALARALCSAPRLLLLDEPFSGLDRALSRRLVLFMRSVTQRFAQPLLLVTHDPVEALLLCDWLLVLEKGRVVEQGAPRTLLSQQKVAASLPESGYENAWSGEVIACDGIECRLAVAPDVEFAGTTSRDFGARVGQSAVVEVSARDVILARARPDGISARNCMLGTVTSLADHTGHVLVGVRLGTATTIFSEVSHAAVRELELAADSPVTVVIKASACRAHA